MQWLKADNEVVSIVPKLLKLDQLVDDRFGPFAAFRTWQLSQPNPPWWIASCNVARAPTGTWFKPFPHSSAGSHLCRGEAMLKALGEAAERYSAFQSVYFDSLTKRRLGENPYFNEFPRCDVSEEASASLTCDANLQVSHAAMTDFTSGVSVEMPAALVHLGFAPENEPAVFHPISTGLAFHTDPNLALLSGIYEVIERDALMITWLYPSLAKRINLSQDKVSLELKKRINLCDKYRLKVNFVLINVDPPPPEVVMCVLVSDKYPFHAVGTGAASTMEQAAIKALDEAISIRVFCQFNKSESEQVYRNRIFLSLQHHSLFYASERASDAFNFINGLPTIELPSMEFNVKPGSHHKNILRNLATQLPKRNLSVLWRDITAPEIRQYGSVLRVVIPQAVPLSQTYSARWLGTPRIKIKANLFGSCAIQPRSDPHPFS